MRRMRAIPTGCLLLLVGVGLRAANEKGISVYAEETQEAQGTELVCSEYCVVTFQLARSAPAAFTIDGKDQEYRKLSGNLGKGENNQREGQGWAASGKRAMVVCGYLFPASRPIVDVVPDAPKAGEPLVCKIVAPSEDAKGKVIEKYLYQWKRFEGDKWVAAEMPAEPKLSAGVTKPGQRWACSVVAVAADGAKSEAPMSDEVEVGKAKPGDSRIHDRWGWTYGQWRYNRGYLKFDLTSLAGKKVKRARLRLFCDVQVPPYVLRALATSNSWNQRTITWVNQPLSFPCDDKPVGTVILDYGPEATADNPATPSDTWASTPQFGVKRAPAWREIVVSAYVRRAVAAGEKQLSVCLACEDQSGNDHKRVIIFNENRLGSGEKDRGDMRPRLAVETK